MLCRAEVSLGRGVCVSGRCRRSLGHAFMQALHADAAVGVEIEKPFRSLVQCGLTDRLDARRLIRSGCRASR